MTLTSNAKFNLTVASVAVGTLPLVAMLFSLIRGSVSLGRRRTKPDPAWDTAPKPLTDRDLSAWYLSDSPLEAPEDDLFGHRLIARRIAVRFGAQEPPAQALVGRLGTGKTTVRRLVQRYLEQHPSDSNLRFISVELWPYETPRAAVEGILEAVLEAFSTEISTSQLSGIPAEYGELIAKLAGVSHWLPKVTAPKSEIPSALLRRFDDVATAIGTKCVLWVDDLERFAAGHGNEPGTPAELERLAPIRALLAGLDRLRSITVVTATTDLDRRFDLEKIARYVETLPEVDFCAARRIISSVRAKWLEEAKALVLGLYDHSERLGWDSKASFDDLNVTTFEVAFLSDKIASFASAIAALATTPRALKQGLRRAHETWSALRGEIDIDDVLALSMLRESSPHAFALLEKNVGLLRRYGHARHDEKQPIVLFNEQLESLDLDNALSRPRNLLSSTYSLRVERGFRP